MNAHPPARPRMARISLFGITAGLMLTGITLWVSSSHSAVKAAIEPPQIDRVGFILALVCMALAIVVASAIFAPAPVGSGINFSEITTTGL